MKKLLVSILFFSNFYCFASQIEQSITSIDLKEQEENFMVSIKGQESFEIQIKPSLLCQLGMIKSSSDFFLKDKEIALRERFSKEGIEVLVEYLKIEELERKHRFLGALTFDKILALTDSAMALDCDIDVKILNHTMLNYKRALNFFDYTTTSLCNISFEDLNKLYQKNFLQNHTFLLSVLLKKIKFKEVTYVPHYKYGRCLPNENREKMRLLESMVNFV